MKYKCVILLLVVLVLTACEQKIDYAGVFEIEALDNDTVRICNSRQNHDSAGKVHLSGIVRIPKTVYGKKVVEIGQKAFSGCNQVMEFIIPNTVKVIGEDAFLNCNSLRTVTFEDPYGWQAGGTALTLTDPKKNAEYLKDTYGRFRWYK